MKILLIDNGTLNLVELKLLLGKNKVTTIDFSKISSTDINPYDLIILSGGSRFAIAGNEQQYQQELSLIRNISKPIIGICLGFELIAHAFGAELTKMDNKEKGFVQISVTLNDNIFANLPNFSVYESHRWVIKTIPETLIELANSESGIEVIRHKSRPIYGFQFHPEMFLDKSCGNEIFNNLLAYLEANI